MSHFSVTVVTDTPNQNELDAILQPFHEYECTGIKDEYVRFVPAEESLDEMKDEHRNHLQKYPDSTKEDLGQFISSWYGYEMRDGVWGRETNPDRKWDYWMVGGRWVDQLLLKNGSRANHAQVKDIDFDKMIQNSVDEAAAQYNKVISLIAGLDWITFEEAKSKFNDIEAAREFYRNQEAVVKTRKEFGPFFNLNKYKSSREEIIEQARRTAITTFAYLDKNGWQERGSMGWFACIADEKDNWDETCTQLIQKAPDDKYITIVDCHI